MILLGRLYLNFINLFFILSVTIFFYSTGRSPFLNLKRQYQLLIGSLSLLLLIFTYRLYLDIFFTRTEVILLLVVIFISFAVGVQRKYKRGSLLYQKKSYGLIKVEENQSKNIRVIKRDNKTLSGIDILTLKPTSRVLLYPHLCELFPVRPKRVLCIGGGSCAYPIYAINKDPNVYIDVIEKDQFVIEAAKKFFPVPENNRFKLIRADGLNWIQKNISKYDLIFIDVGIIISRNNKFYNNNFLSNKALKNYLKLLDYKGAIILNIITTRNEKDKVSVHKKLNGFYKNFQAHLVFQTNPKASPDDLQDLIYLYSRQKVTIPNLLKILIKTKSRKLSYPKNVYKNLLISFLKS